MADLRSLKEWSGPDAALTLWRPSAASMNSALNAPASPVPPSFEQEQHLRAFRAAEHQNEEMARLLIIVWEEPGTCDIRTMSHVVTAHLRRHDTYHSRFEARDDGITRHVLATPADIQMEPEALGVVSAAAWQQQVIDTPSPFAWDCFRFGILQRADGFTFFASIDHLHADATVIAFLLEEIHTAYHALLDGETPPCSAPPGRYLDYCTSQRQRTARVTLGDPDVAAWIDFLDRNGGRMPPFPLPLGIFDDRCLAEHVRMEFLDAAGVAAFESSCQLAGARVIGGLLACAALTERELAGAARYSVVSPVTTRRTTEAVRTTGWCMGIVPIDFDLSGRSFPELAVAAQSIFDERLNLCHVPIEHAFNLAADQPNIRSVATGGVMLSYLDTSLSPLRAHITGDWQQLDGKIYINTGIVAQVAIWFFRTHRGLALTISYPANEVARGSMQRYIEVLKHMCRKVAMQAVPIHAAAGDCA